MEKKTKIRNSSQKVLKEKQKTILEDFKSIVGEGIGVQDEIQKKKLQNIRLLPNQTEFENLKQVVEKMDRSNPPRYRKKQRNFNKD